MRPIARILIVPLLAALTGCGASPEPQAAEAPPVSVAVSAVKKREVGRYGVFTGQVKAVEEVEVRPRVTGQLTEVNFADGSEVVPDPAKPLYVVDPVPFRAEVDRQTAEAARARAGVIQANGKVEEARGKLAQASADVSKARSEVVKARASVEQAEAVLDQASSQLDLKRKNLARDLEVAGTPGAISAQQVDVSRATAVEAEANVKAQRANVGVARAAVTTAEGQVAAAQASEAAAKAAVTAAESDVKTAEAAVQTADAALELAKIQLGWTSIPAPIAGRLDRTLLTVGNQVTAYSTVLTKIVRMDPVYVYFDVDERTELEIKERLAAGTFDEGGVSVDVGLVTETGYPHKATVDFIGSMVDPTAGTRTVRARLGNPIVGRLETAPLQGAGARGGSNENVRLFGPGLFVRVRMPVGRPQQALLVPDEAVGTDQGQKYVLVVGAGNVAEYRPVQLGERQPDGMRVIEPLKIVRAGPGAFRPAKPGEAGEDSLKAGERVIVEGLQLVQPGQTVAPKAP